MKNVVRALICVSISLIVLNCTNDETMPVQGKVQFALAITDTPSDGGRISSQSFPNGAYISLSIETASGASVYSLKKVDLIKLGDGYITAPLALTEGSYHLTDFFVISASNEILYATPKEGSPLAGLVEDPLPMNFTITADGIVNLSIQVIDVNQQSPEDFGYVSFGVEMVGSDYSVSLFIADGDDVNLASGKLELYQGNDLVYQQDLEAKTNAVNFKGDLNSTYTLVIQKEGYSIFHREYTLHNLIEELDGEPLTIFVVPALTFTIRDKYSTPSLHTLLIDFSGSSSNLTIDWGDGSVQHGIDFNTAGPSHGYGSPGQLFYINISGDIDGISRIGCNYQLPVDVQKIDVTSLTGLTQFVMVLTQNAAPKFIDFSKNPKLISLALEASHIERIDISNNNLLSTLDISGTAISEENFNGIISDLYSNANENNLQGELAFVFIKNPFFGPRQPLFPISEESKIKLVDLRDNHNWTIVPTDF